MTAYVLKAAHGNDGQIGFYLARIGRAFRESLTHVQGLLHPKSVVSLRTLDDRTLRDIGVHRSQIAPEGLTGKIEINRGVYEID